ncbi:MAG TPA: hypothetical protein VGL39_23310 [Jatrophihabitantaceae bacterium]
MSVEDPAAGWGLVAEHVELPNGDQAATVVSETGGSSYWILRPGSCDCSRCMGDASPDSAPHEQHGRLPAYWRSRVHSQRAVRDQPPEATL